MSERERAEGRADMGKDEADSGTEQETPDVEAHRFDHGRAEAARLEEGSEAEDRHRNDLGTSSTTGSSAIAAAGPDGAILLPAQRCRTLSELSRLPE